MVVTILVALTVTILIAYLSLRKKETKHESEIKHVIADVELVEFENEEPAIPETIVEEKSKVVKKKVATKKTTAKKSTKNGK